MDKKRNVMQLMDFSSQYKGSFIESMLALESELNKNGISMLYVFPQRTKQRGWAIEMLNSGKKVFFMPDNPLKAALMVRRLVKAYEISIIHSHFASMNFHFPARIARLGRSNVKYIIHIHSNLKKSRNRFSEFIRKLVVRADFYVCVSKALQEIIAEKGYKSVLVHNAVDFSRLDNFETVKKSDISIEENQKAVLMFGYDIYIKGVDVALKAIAKHDQNREITLLLVVANHRVEVEKGIMEIFGEIPSWVKILPPRNDIATYFLLSDVFLSASRLEGFAYTIVESAYLKTPIIATNIPGQNERHVPGIVWIEKENEKQLYDALMNVFSRSEMQSEDLAETAKKYVLKNYDINHWVKNIIAHYK